MKNQTKKLKINRVLFRVIINTSTHALWIMLPNNEDSDCGPEKTGDFAQHALQDTWLWWSNKVKREQAWESLLVRIHVFRTVEEFWSLYEELRHPVDLTSGCELSVFKRGVAPKWEDPQNASGGRWVFEVPTERLERRPSGDCAGDPYLKLLLFVIGDNLGADTEFLNGVVCGVRSRRIKISIWLSVCDDRAKQIGEAIWQELGVAGEWYFETFDNARRRDRNNRGVVKTFSLAGGRGRYY